RRGGRGMSSSKLCAWAVAHSTRPSPILLRIGLGRGLILPDVVEQIDEIGIVELVPFRYSRRREAAPFSQFLNNLGFELRIGDFADANHVSSFLNSSMTSPSGPLKKASRTGTGPICELIVTSFGS